MALSSLALQKHLTPLRDPRRQHRRRHLLIDIVTIAICAALCGADSWPKVVKFGHRRRDWLQRFLRLPHGIPSHDTFERVFGLLDPAMFQRCFVDWTQTLRETLGKEHIAIDGKTLRGSAAPTSGLGALHIVSAWATKANLTLGQVAVDEKSNEITAIPQLLAILDLKGAWVTIDAMGCQKEIAQKIVAGGGDYLLTVKDNQEGLADDIRACFTRALDADFAGLEFDEYGTEEKGHGRVEKRHYTIMHDPEGIRSQELWAKLKVIGMCRSERVVNGKTSEEVRYFIGSKRAGARYYGKALRDHWRVENSLHWRLDVVLGEDANRVQQRNAAANLAALRRMVLNLLKRCPRDGSIACKQWEAALDPDVLEEILDG
jgi:predicted transposase YbfD/YdcC